MPSTSFLRKLRLLSPFSVLCVLDDDLLLVLVVDPPYSHSPRLLFSLCWYFRLSFDYCFSLLYCARGGSVVGLCVVFHARRPGPFWVFCLSVLSTCRRVGLFVLFCFHRPSLCFVSFLRIAIHPSSVFPLLVFPSARSYFCLIVFDAATLARASIRCWHTLPRHKNTLLGCRRCGVGAKSSLLLDTLDRTAMIRTVCAGSQRTRAPMVMESEKCVRARDGRMGHTKKRESQKKTAGGTRCERLSSCLFCFSVWLLTFIFCQLSPGLVCEQSTGYDPVTETCCSAGCVHCANSRGWQQTASADCLPFFLPFFFVELCSSHVRLSTSFRRHACATKLQTQRGIRDRF